MWSAVIVIDPHATDDRVDRGQVGYGLDERVSAKVQQIVAGSIAKYPSTNTLPGSMRNSNCPYREIP